MAKSAGKAKHPTRLTDGRAHPVTVSHAPTLGCRFDPAHTVAGGKGGSKRLTAHYQAAHPGQLAELVAAHA